MKTILIYFLKHNDLLQLISVMYMRRAGLPWADIMKITGHASAVTLVRHYDCTLEAPGLANIASIVGTGHNVARGSKVPITKLQVRKRTADKTSDMERESSVVSKSMAACKSEVNFDISPTNMINEYETGDETLCGPEREYICPAAADADAAAGLGEGNDGYEDFSRGGMRCNQDERNASWEESKCNAKRTFVDTNKTINAGENSVEFKSHSAAIPKSDPASIEMSVTERKMKAIGLFTKEVVKGAVEGATGILNSILSSDLEITAKYECHTENSVQRVEVSTVSMFSINCSLYYWQVSSKPSQQS